MADVTRAGTPVDEKSQRLAKRRLALQIHRLHGAVMQAELEIVEFEDNILRRKEQIAATLEQIADLEEQLNPAAT